MTLYSIPPFLTLCCFIGLAVLAAWHGRKTRTNLLFFIICLIGVLLYIDILLAFNLKSAATALLVSRIDHFFLVYLFPVYLHFFHRYLGVSKRQWLIQAAYVYAFVLMCLSQTPFYITSMQQHFFGYYARAGKLFVLFDAASLFVTVYVLILILQAIRNAPNSARKNSLKYVFAGFGTMGFINALSVLPLHGYSIYPPGNFSFIPLAVFGVGLFRHDLLDMGILIKNLEQKVAARTRDLEKALVAKERAQEQLIRSESLAAIGQLVAGVAHELNNPLASVTGILQATIEDLTFWDQQTPLDEDLLDDLKFADTELARAKSIVASLLSLSRQTQTYSEAVNLNIVVKDALRVLFNQHKYNDLNIIENYDPQLPDIHGNFANLGQVAMNLIQNAMQATDQEPATIILETRFDQNASEAVFTCTDNGPGIPESIRPDIFKPFFTTKAPGQGTGLGLYLCHEIIRKHGGTLTLANTTVKGAKFVLRLPTGNQSPN